MKAPILLSIITVLVACPRTGAQWQPEPEWFIQFGTGQTERAASLCADGEGGVFLAALTFGVLAGPAAGERDAVIARYDAEGRELWTRQFGTSDWDAADAVAADGSGGAYLGGTTGGALAGPSAGQQDAFLARYDGEGNQVWIIQFGAERTDRVLALATAPGGDGVFVGGQGSLEGPSAGGIDAFVALFDAAGGPAWIRQLGSSGHDYVRALAVADTGDLFVSGETWGPLGGPHLGGYSDAFLAKYDPDGNQIWIVQIGSASQDEAYALTRDGAGGVFIGGGTVGDLGGTARGAQDAWLARYDSDGNQLWITKISTAYHDRLIALEAVGAGGVLAAGYVGNRDPIWNLDAFVARYSETGAREVVLADRLTRGRFGQRPRDRGHWPRRVRRWGH